LTAIAIGLWISNGAAATAIASIVVLIGVGYLAASSVMYWSSRFEKARARDRILDGIAWRGDEKVLDAGCGRGLFAIGAAKRLKSGRVTGVDVWRAQDLSGNSADAARENAKAEGVADRVKLDTADIRKLPFPADSFDVVVSGLALHHLDQSADRAAALREMSRVLKPGGRLAIFDILYTNEYAKALQEIGLADVSVSGMSLLWCAPTRSLTARKP
jgi:ubiquinone/menaquinone biosynthesis C-methylase UbiE